MSVTECSERTHSGETQQRSNTLDGVTDNEQERSRESELASGWTVQPERLQVPEPDAEAAEAVEGTQDSEQVSSVGLMLLGVFGGLYLLYTWGWFEIAQVYSAINDATASGSGVIGGVLQQIVFWLAPVAPATWFLTTYLLTKQRGSLALLLGLILGAIVLLPFPLIAGGA